MRGRRVLRYQRVLGPGDAHQTGRVHDRARDLRHASHSSRVLGPNRAARRAGAQRSAARDLQALALRAQSRLAHREPLLVTHVYSQW